MAKFRRSLQYEEMPYLSGSDSDPDDISPRGEDRDFLPPASKKQKRQTKLPSKLREYETEQTIDGDVGEEPCWCIIEWDGENTYDCLHRDKLTSLEGDLAFQRGEKVLAVFKGKPFKATIAVIAATKKEAENSYNKNKQPHQSNSKSEDVLKSRKDASQIKPVKRKAKENKTKSQNQKNQEAKATLQRVQREQMKEVLMESKANNFQTDDEIVVESPKYSSSPKVTATLCTVENTCCQQCESNQAAVKRNLQALQILQQGVSALQDEVQYLRKLVSKRDCFTPSPDSQSKAGESVKKGSPHMSAVSHLNVTAEDGKDEVAIGQPRPAKSPGMGGGLSEIPHHLRSRAASAGSLKKATRVLAVGLFTVRERSSCTVSGSSNKHKEDKTRPQFDPSRMALIHDFLSKTFPKTYTYPEVNRIVGQVAIESRLGRHSTDDSVVISLLENS